MKKTTKKNLFDILSIIIIILLIASVLFEFYPMLNNDNITLHEVKNSLIVPGMLLLLHTIIKAIGGELLWLSNTVESLEGLPLILLILLIILGVTYSISKDKMYFDFAKVIFGSLAGALAQKKISSKKE